MAITLKEILELANAELGVMTGPESSTTDSIPAFSDASGKLLGEAPATMELITGTNEIQTLNFSQVPGSGSLVLDLGGEQTTAIQWNDDAAAVKAAIETISFVNEVTVTGSFASQQFTVEFTGADAKKPFPEFTVSSDTLAGGE